MPAEPRANGWPEYQRLVLAELERHNAVMVAMNIALGEIRVELAMLKIKASIWGALAGMIPVLLALGMLYLRGVK